MNTPDAIVGPEVHIDNTGAAITIVVDDVDDGGRTSSSERTLNQEYYEINRLSNPCTRDLESKAEEANFREELDPTEEMKWFLTTFGSDYSPLLMLRALCRSNKTRGTEAVRLFKLAYPILKGSLEELFDHLKRFEQDIRTQCCGYGYEAAEPTFEPLVWTSNSRFFRYNVPQFCRLMTRCADILELTNVAEQPRLLITRITACWEKLRMPLLAVGEALQMLSPFIQVLDSVIPLLQGVQTSFFEAETVLYNTLKDQQIQAVTTDPGKDASFTTTLQIHCDIEKTRSRSRSRRPQPRPSPTAVSKGFQKIGGDVKTMAVQRFRWLEEQWTEGNFGSRRFAQVLIFTLSGAAALTTGLAIWKCASAQSIPLVDSNFWSCIAQQLLGFAGLYCIVIPMLQQKGFNAKHRRWFKAFLYITLIAGVGAMPAYPFQQQTSMALAFVSGLSGLLATLQLIEDQTQQISDNSDMISVLQHQVDYLENRR